ncbi:TetR/AcrR family transcriptional regulator [Paenibacillus sp. GCM10012306]|uniref:TetR/AcrR family transcriptional regulator n=1 Tax=Paenibacillus sp. GCM10012306 TaxID=3317342 RepID=UPI00360E9264
MASERKVDRRITKTKEAINRAFLELFAEKELEQITINEIADQANVNRGTVYLHYSDKYDLLDQYIEEHLNKLISFCGTHEPATSATSMDQDELQLVFDYLGEHFRFFSAILLNQRTALFRERLLQFISSNVKEKLDQQTAGTAIDNEINAEFMSSAFVGILEWWIRNKMPHPPAYMAAQVRHLFEKNEVYMQMKS